MNLPTAVATLALAVVVFLALRYMIKEKRKGTRCIGCPYADSCNNCGDVPIDHIVDRCRASSEKE